MRRKARRSSADSGNRGIQHVTRAVVLSVLLTCSVAAADSPLLFAKAHYPAGSAPESVAIGDLDGDQVPDLAVANSSSDNVSVLLGLGDGTFAPAAHYPAGDWANSVAIGDLDGDQVPDLAVANGAGDNVSVLLGLGDGTFAPAAHYPAGDGADSVAIDDLDGDQVLDLAVANSSSDNVSVLLGLGDGTFAPAAHYPAGDGAASVAIGDLDGDQVLDLAVAINGNVSVLLGSGDGTFAPAAHYPAGGADSVAIGDLNGDQVLDLAVANGGSVSVLLGLGDGTFTAAVHYSGGGYYPFNRSVAIGDLDGDGDSDLAVADYGDPWLPSNGDVFILLGRGDGTFGDATHYTTGLQPVSVAIGDLDGDGWPDLAVANNMSYYGITAMLNQGPDCNGNGVPDDEDIGAGTSADCNGNLIPDECDIATESFLLSDFEGYTAGAEVMFQDPRFSGTTRDHLTLTPNDAFVVNDQPAFSGDGTERVRWGFVDTLPQRWMRLTTYNANYLPNPTIPLDCSIRVRLRVESGQFRIALGVRETGTTAEFGDDGGVSGTIEWVGATSVTDGAPQGVLVEPQPGVWQTIVFDLLADPVLGFTGDGVLATATNKGTLEHLAFAVVDNAGPFTVYVDDVEIFYEADWPDCNANGVPDSCDIDEGTSADLNGNGIPDECEDLLAGDFNGDGDVDFADFSILADCMMGPGVAFGVGCGLADLDGEGDVDLADFAEFQAIFGGDPQ